MSPWLCQRAVLDRVVAAVLLVLVSPVVALVAAAKSLEDPGPPFVRIPRVGRHGRPLRIVKIRSMRATGPDGLASGSSISAGNDDRTTPLGRVLRRYRLDELPQLAHVVTGSMSLFGPRPEAPEMVTSDPAWAVILSVRPGIAGPTQLVFEDLEGSLPAGDTADFYAQHVLPVKLVVDQWYVTHASPATDARVLVGLIQRFVLRRPPTVLTQYVERDHQGLAERLVATAQLGSQT